jgi:hypothetical protein
MRVVGWRGVAALCLVSTASAKSEYEGWYVLGTDPKAVFAPLNPIGSVIVVGKDGNIPEICPEGAFYEISDDLIGVCGRDAKFQLREPPSGVQLPANAKILLPWPPGGGEDTDTPPPSAVPVPGQ